MHRLPESTVRQISSSQVISSVTSVVKELIENAIDAGSTSIDVRLENFGIDKIEIRDNGDGIKSSDVSFVAKQHYTSKLQSFDDLAQLLTYGFRGEALASLCAVADVTITTKAIDVDIGSTYRFDDKGNVIDCKPSHLPQGTTVTATDLFKRFPVRRNYFSSKKKCREELRRCDDCLSAFAAIKPNLRISFRHNKEVVWTKVVASDIKQSLAAVVGGATVASMRHITRTSVDPQFQLEAFLPEPGPAGLQASRSSSDRLMIFVNDRPVSMPEISKLLRNCFSRALSSTDYANKFPVAFIRLVVPPSVVDVNLEPNKTRVLLHDQAEILAFLSTVFEEVFGGPSSACSKDPELQDTNEVYVNPSADCGELAVNSLPDIESDCSDLAAILDTAAGIETFEGCAPNICDFDLSTASETLQPASCEVEMLNNVDSENLISFGLYCAGNDVNQVSASESDWDYLHSENGARHRGDRILSGRNTTFSVELEDMELSSDMLPKRNTVEESSFDHIHGSFKVLGVEVSGVNLTEMSNEEIGVEVPVLNLRSSCINEVPGIDPRTSNNGESSGVEVLGVDHRLSSTGLIRDVIAADWSKGHAVRDSMNNLVEPVKVLTGGRGFMASASNSPAASNIQTKQPTLPDLLSGKVSLLNGQGGEDVAVQAAKRRSSDKVATECIKQPNKKFKHNSEKGMQSICIDKLLEPRRQSDVCETTLGRSVTLPFSWSRLTPGAPTETRFRAGAHNQLRVVGALKSHGVWVCLRDDDDIVLLHSIRAKEQMMYLQMMSNHALPVELLDQPINLDAKLLCSADCYTLLLSMSKSAPTPTEPYSHITDERLVKNGFIIRQHSDSSGRDSLQIISMTRCIGFYGLLDLNETLTAILRTNQCKLINCRPLKVKHYFQAEASRISRQLNSGSSLTEVKDLVKEISLLLQKDSMEKCFHNRPIVVRLSSMSKLKKKNS